MMKHQKCLEFYLPWALSLFNLPKDFNISILEEHPTDENVRGSFTRDVGYSKQVPDIILYSNHLPSIVQMMTTLFHELTHAQQWHESRLIDWVSPRMTIWRDTPDQSGWEYSPELLKKRYWDLPWEIEARKVADDKCVEFVDRFFSINPFRIVRWWFFKPQNKTKFIIRNGKLVG
jgi:hypothetical protein